MYDPPCAICGSVRVPAATHDVRDYVTGDRFTVARCRECGYGVTAPRPPSLDRYYPARYRGFNPLAAMVLRRLYRRRVDGWVRRLPRPGVALEIGSGTGWMLKALRDHGWRAVGSERDIDAARIAQRRSGAPMFVGGLDALRREPFLDLVVLFHVLEHLPDPIPVIRGLAAVVKPGGTLVLGLPNGASWQCRFAGRHWMHLDVPRHLVHFTPDSIERALVSSGFRVTEFAFTSFEHDPLGWVQGTLDRLGFEQALILKRLIGLREGRAGLLATAAAFVLAIPLGVIGLGLAVVSWSAGAGAVMQVWAVREP